MRRPDYSTFYRIETSSSRRTLVRIGKAAGALLAAGLLVAGFEMDSETTPSQSYTYTIPGGEKLFDTPVYGTSCGNLTEPRQVTDPEIVQGPPGTTEKFIHLNFEGLAASAAGACGSDRAISEDQNHSVYVDFADLVDHGQS